MLNREQTINYFNISELPLCKERQNYSVMSCSSVCLRIRLSCPSKPFVHFFLVGEQLLNARAFLHALEIRAQIGGSRKVHFQLGDAAAAPKEMRSGAVQMVEEVRSNS